MRKSVKLKDIVEYAKGSQINGDNLIEEAEFDYLNGGINPSGKWNETNCDANTITISEGGNSCGYVNYMRKPFWCGAHCYYLYNVVGNKQYLYYALKSQQDRIMKLRSGACMPNIKKGDLGDFEFNFDDDVEGQDKVTNILSKLESVIEERKQELLCLDKLTKARFVEMFGDVKHEEKYKGIPLRELCITMSGGTPSTKNTEYYEGNIPWITTVSLGPNHIDGSTAKGYITQEAIKNSATKLIPAGNILFGTRVGVGKSSINDVDICTNQDIIAIIGIDENRFNRVFIKHVLDDYQPYYDSLKKGATILGITSDDLKDTLIPDAPIDVQAEFVAFVDQVDKSKVAVQKSLDEAQLLFDSLMQQYFG